MQGNDYLSIITAPDPCNKIVSISKKGTCKKRSLARISRGQIETIHVPDLAAFENVYRQVAEREDQCLVLGFVPGTLDRKVLLFTEKRLKEILKEHTGSDQLPDTAIEDADGTFAVARLKRYIQPSSWFMFDYDQPEGMPDKLRTTDPDEWLGWMVALFPEIEGAAKLYAPSNSSRVFLEGNPAFDSRGFHVYMQARGSSDIARFGKDLFYASLATRFGYTRSIKCDGVDVVRHGTIFDVSTFSPERIDFCGRPELADKRLSLLPLNVRTYGGKRLATGKFEVADDLIEKIKTETGLGRSTAAEFHAEDLRLDTIVIDRHGDERAVRELLPKLLKGQGKVKLQAYPFRPESVSLAAFLRLDDQGNPLMHDVGTGTSHHLAEADLDEWLGTQTVAPATKGKPLTVNNQPIPLAGDLVEDTKAIRIAYDDMLDRMVQIGAGNRYAFMDKPRQSYTYTEMRSLLASNKVRVGRGIRESFEVWTEDPDRLQAISFTFHPGKPSFVIGVDLEKTLNTWLPRHRQPMPDAVVDHLVDPFLKHVEYLFGKRTDDFLDWLAHIEQEPGVLPHTFWLHISPIEGTGRSWLGNVLDRVWSPYTATGVNLSKLMGSDFNQMLSGRILCVVEEIKEGGRGAWVHSQSLKAAITEDTRIINAKGQPEYREPNKMRWLMFSNHLSALPLSNEDRRCQVVTFGGKQKDDDYYTDLYRLKDTHEFINAIGLHLAGRDIGQFNPGARAPLTDDKRLLINAYKSREDKIIELLQDPDVWKWPVVTSSFLLGAFTGETDITGPHIREAHRYRAKMNQLPVVVNLNYKKTRITVRSTVGLLSEDEKKSWSLLKSAKLKDFVDKKLPISRAAGVRFAEDVLDKHDL